jgi:hypothetical protein
VKQKTTSLLLFLSLLALVSPIQSMAQSRCSAHRGRNGAASVAQIAPLGSSALGVAGGGLLGGPGFGIANAPLGLLGSSGFGVANAPLGLLGGSPLGLLGGSGVRVGNTNVGLFNGPGILNYDYHHSWMPGAGGAALVIGTGAGAGAVAGTLVSHKDKKKGAIIGAAAGAGGATLLWLYKNRTERRAIF